MNHSEPSNLLITRYAPTPSGYLHLGNALNFLLTWVEAKKRNAKILLRIDDLDVGRSRDEYINDILESLQWLDLEYNFGPTSVDEFHKDFSQLTRIEIYREKLIKYSNKLFYACDCTRSQINKSSSDGTYRGNCRDRQLNFTPGETAMRLLVSPEFEYLGLNLFNEMGDFIVWRKDDLPSYQLASIIDDEYFKINFIIRGEDLQISTVAQKYLSQVLNIKSFSNIDINFHQLFLDENSKKMSKSEGASSLKSMRSQYQDKRFAYNRIAELLGITESKDINSKEDFLKYVMEKDLNFLIF